MKKPEEYLREAGLIVKDKSIDEMFALNLTRDGHRSSLKTILRVINLAQVNAWNEALEDAVESVDMKSEEPHPLKYCDCLEYSVDLDSILKLKK